MVRRSVWAAAALLCVACGGGSAVERTTAPDAPTSPFTELPTQAEPPAVVFQRADMAFQQGDFVTAQREFGTLFITAPDYNGGVAQQGLTATCQSMQQDCTFVLGRLTFMRDAYYGQFGPMQGWQGRQRQDYEYILDCYEAAMMRDFRGAISIGERVIGAPHAAYDFHARQCTNTSRSAVAAIERQQRADQALIVWQQHVACMNEHRVQLLAAARDEAWETLVGRVEPYRSCAEPLQQIIDSELLMGDPRLGMEHDIVWTNMSEVDAVLEDNGAVIDQTRQGLRTLQTHSGYQRSVAQWMELDRREQELLAQRAEYERAASVLSGSARDGVLAQVSSVDQQIAAVRQDKRDAMVAVNAIRRDLGLQSRERP